MLVLHLPSTEISPNKDDAKNENVTPAKHYQTTGIGKMLLVKYKKLMKLDIRIISAYIAQLMGKNVTACQY